MQMAWIKKHFARLFSRYAYHLYYYKYHMMVPIVQVVIE